MKYSINFVRKIRLEEKKAEARRLKTLTLCVVCFGVLVIAVFYSFLQVLRMQQVLKDERDKLARIEAEYRKYRETKMIVNKEDIELLDRLQNGRIFWTKKLASMAFHLPDNYWITTFGYNKRNIYNVEGYGYISQKQEQLITLDDYLNKLRADRNFSDVLKVSFLNLTEREDEGRRLRVSFEFSSQGSKSKKIGKKPRKRGAKRK